MMLLNGCDTLDVVDCMKRDANLELLLLDDKSTHTENWIE